METIVEIIKSTIKQKGIKLKHVSEVTQIPYGRLNRIFNQGSALSATEFLELCVYLEIDPNTFKKIA